MEHSFDVDTAKKYGMEKAVLLKNISFWVLKNFANKKHFHDGFFWTYNSREAFSKLFPYMSEQKIGRHLRELEELKLIKSGNYNKVSYDRTKWYTVPSLFIVQNQTMDCLNDNNSILNNEQPIPDINTDIKSDKKDILSSKLDGFVKEIIDHLNHVTNSKYKHTTKSHAENIRARLNDGHSVDELKIVIDDKFKEWGDDNKMAQYVRPSTLFATKNFNSYLTKARVSKTKKESAQSKEQQDTGCQMMKELSALGLLRD